MSIMELLHSIAHIAVLLLWYIFRGILALIVLGSCIGGLLVFTMILAPLFHRRN
jgi:hypothetical protein